ncbi:MAG: T9SS type A sorting domain-containing protein, partial [Calditrichaeota bacterium]|nr:T9SS type A sorting domain-containing protein [Calditrichota bacterium]
VEQNYPNPFNPETRIQYRIPEAAFVQLTIFNLKGQQVRMLEASQKSRGTYSVIWDGKDNIGRQVSSGVYLYRLSVEPLSENGTRFEESRKLLLIR